MIKNIKAKGASAEREFLRLVNDRIGADLKRNLEQVRSGGYDLIGLNLAIEVKRCETLAIPSWIRQAKRQAKPGQPWALAFRQSRKPWKIILPMSFIAPDEVWTEDHTAVVDLETFCQLCRRRLP